MSNFLLDKSDQKENLLIPVFATFWIVSFPEIPMMKLFAKIVGYANDGRQKCQRRNLKIIW